ESDEQVDERDDGKRARAAVLDDEQEVRPPEPGLSREEPEEGEESFTDEGEHVAAASPPADRGIADAGEERPGPRAAAARPVRHRGCEREEPPHAFGQPVPIDLDPALRAP